MKKSEFKSILDKATIKQLLKLGFRKWNDDKKPTLMLIPGSMFDSIPKGFPLTCISGEQIKFDTKTTDDDTRFGCIPYGILKNK